MNINWRNVETFSEKLTREEMMRRKQRDQEEKNQRLLKRLAPELEAARKKWQSSIWSSISYFPSGGVFYMGFPKPDRRHDTRRVTESFPRIRGWRTTQAEEDLNSMEIRKRTVIGNRNGSEKIWEDRTKSLRQLPRKSRKHIALREVLEELAAEKELEILRRLAEADLQVIDEEMSAGEFEKWLNWEEFPFDDNDTPWS